MFSGLIIIFESDKHNTNQYEHCIGDLYFQVSLFFPPVVTFMDVLCGAVCCVNRLHCQLKLCSVMIFSSLHFELEDCVLLQAATTGVA